ncbi:DUF1176 domain-containing protein [Sphingomonas sp. R647]|uniref:DUF1176 domain-containing protein n=1 Tax=Sphingomonas sp. R647 TaxID=2875233 RepID=UPI001CD1CAA4|nr:DUF1176 domain-containing protein [Sphingomonas sp. R647]MCA1197608.1 DUF1176 domain-containing protein [Sphingomonas sp. R647]
MLILAAFALAQSAPAPQQGPMKTFGDWVVACDNVKQCEMTSLQPEGGDWSDAGWQMAVTREAGPAGGWAVELMGEEAPGGPTVHVEGAPAASAAAVWRGDAFSGAEALTLVGALANGKVVIVRDSAGKSLGRISLSGSSASLRFIDAEQGRAGTTTAVIAKGANPASAVPAAPSLPVIASIRPAGTPAVLSPTLLNQLWTQSDCAENYSSESLPEVERYALGGGATLALVPCGAGAYNFSSIAYLVRDGKVQVAGFDSAPGWTADGPAMLVNVGFDLKTGELGSYAKGRGIGDCGSAETYVWDGTRFRLTEARAMGECRGSINWLTVWRAKAVPR